MKLNKEKAQLAAQQILNYYFIESPSDIDLDKIAFALNISLNCVDLKGASARILHNGKKGFVDYDLSLCSNEGRKRFAIAHEIGHFQMHKESLSLKKCTDDDLEVWFQPNKVKEVEANFFASELLLPSDFVSPYCDKQVNMETVIEIAETFNTSITAAALKYIDLNYNPCAIAFCKNKKIIWIKGSPEYYEYKKFFIRFDSELHTNTEAFKFFSNKDYSDKQIDKHISIWFPNVSDHEFYVKEQIFPIPCIDAVITLLYIKEFNF